MDITCRSSSSVDLRAYRKYFGLIFILLLDTKQGQIRPFRRTRPVPIRREATGSFAHSPPPPAPPPPAPSGRVHPAPISFPIFCGSSPHPPPPKGKWKKGNGCGLLRRFVLQKLRKGAKYPLLPISAFSVLAAAPGAPVSAFGGNSCVRSHYASTSH